MPTQASDGEGTSYPPVDALRLVAGVANRPIVVAAETFVGAGAVGGYVLTPAAIGKEAADLALRILIGESASAIPIADGNFVKPIFDWRQMQRWGISASSFPPGSEIRFREPTHEWANAIGLRSVLSVPILREGRPIGVITVNRAEVGPFLRGQVEAYRNSLGRPSSLSRMRGCGSSS